ncbi:sulfurtransferase [Humitalea sp. 24SJ18S-53]|uniref:sulfurtransferase n=1 Tax=Humitalea sp. 24SJ18S-53 TaxID=3422307 RepID=UPI003D664228
MTVPPVVSAAWLAAAPDVQIIDGSWHLPVQGRDAVADYIAQRIPGAVHLDIDTVAARIPGPPGRMMPPPDIFAEEVGKLGLRPDAHLVVYDSVGMYSAARVWWLFRSFGHARVSVMEGGLPAWIRAGGRIESGPPKPLPPTTWPQRPPADAVRNWQQVLANIDSHVEQLIDVRPAASFHGSTAAQYPGVRDGHIPGAVNLSQRDLLNADATFKPAAEIEAIIAAHGVAIDAPIIATCGSGVTACILSLALAVTGREPCPIYDGSWEEWGMRRDLPATVD